MCHYLGVLVFQKVRHYRYYLEKLVELWVSFSRHIAADEKGCSSNNCLDFTHQLVNILISIIDFC